MAIQCACMLLIGSLAWHCKNGSCSGDETRSSTRSLCHLDLVDQPSASSTNPAPSLRWGPNLLPARIPLVHTHCSSQFCRGYVLEPNLAKCLTSSNNCQPFKISTQRSKAPACRNLSRDFSRPLKLYSLIICDGYVPPISKAIFVVGSP